MLILVVPVRRESRALLGAITHVDGTARVQTVSRAANPMYWQLIHEFGKLSGVPIVLNTSFNNNAEPIVDSVEDAVACFLTTGLDLLIVDQFVVRKCPRYSPAMLMSLVPTLVPSRKLVMQAVRAEQEGLRSAYHVKATKSRDFQTQSLVISESTHALLSRTGGGHTVVDLCEGLGLTECQRRIVVDELAGLWSERAIKLRPVPPPDACVLKMSA